MKKKKKEIISEEELLDITQYAVDQARATGNSRLSGSSGGADFSALSIQAAKLAQERKEGKRAIDRLIEQDAASILQKKGAVEVEKPVSFATSSEKVDSRLQKPKKSRRKTAVPSSPSSHILDLRKYYLIEKNKLHSLERPQVPVARKIGWALKRTFSNKSVRWHIPKQTVQHDDSFNEVRWMPSSAAAWGSFIAIFAVLMLPIPAIHFMNSVYADSQLFLSKGSLAFSGLTQGFTDFKGQDFESAALSLSEAGTTFAEVNQDLANYHARLQQLAELVPSVGSKINLARNLGAIGEHSSAVGAILSKTLVSPDSAATTENLDLLRQHFNEISAALSDSRDDILNVKREDVPEEWRDTLIFAQNNVDALIHGMERLDDVITVAHHIMGGESFSRYLFLFQNNRELRPTGGFIGSYARMDFAKGSVSKIEFPGGGTYDLKGTFPYHLIPPRPLSIVNHEWHIWDANWWPDFPTSAKKIAWFYEASGGPTVDGVIAVNSDIMPELLSITGPIEMPDFGVTIDEDNFYTEIQREVELNFDKDLNQPKEILKELYPIVIERLFTSSSYEQLLTALTEALAAKDIQLAVFSDESVAQRVSRLGWDGTMGVTPHDYLAVVSTNIAGGKSDSAVFQTIDHHADINENGEIIVTLKITKEHRGDPSDMFSFLNNVDYLRMYVPKGSTLIRAYGFNPPEPHHFRLPEEYQTIDRDLDVISNYFATDMSSGTEIGEELGKTVFANWMQVAPGEKTSAVVTYRLPFTLDIVRDTGTQLLPWLSPSHEIDGYSLLVRQQSGKKNVIFNSEIRIDPRLSIVWHDSTDLDSVGVTSGLFTFSDELKHDTFNAILISRSSQ